MVERSVGGIVAQLEKQNSNLQQQIQDLTETVKALEQKLGSGIDSTEWNV